MVSGAEGGACASMNAIIAALPQTIKNSYVISSDGCAGRPDHLHFTAEGYRMLGDGMRPECSLYWAMKLLSLKSLISMK